MNNFEKTKKYLLTSIILFVLLLILTISSIVFLNFEKNKNNTLKNDLSLAVKEDVVALKRSIRKYEETTEKINSYIVDKEEVFSFINEIENLAKKEGGVVTVQGIDLFDVLKSGEIVRHEGLDNPERSHGKFLMNIRVDGSWDVVTGFLLKIENIPRHLQIESVKIVSVYDNNTKTEKWSGNFNIITTTN